MVFIWILLAEKFTLSFQKPEGSKAKASKGEAVVGYCQSLVTRDLESSGFTKG